jgi:hypothetical protein
VIRGFPRATSEDLAGEVAKNLLQRTKIVGDLDLQQRRKARQLRPRLQLAQGRLANAHLSG